MFKIICVISVFFSISYTLKCYQCDGVLGFCKGKNDTGKLDDCEKEEAYCLFASDGKDGCMFTI